MKSRLSQRAKQIALAALAVMSFALAGCYYVEHVHHDYYDDYDYHHYGYHHHHY